MGRADGGGRKGLGWAKRDGSTGEMSVRQCGGAAVWQRVMGGGVACHDIYICMYMYEYIGRVAGPGPGLWEGGGLEVTGEINGSMRGGACSEWGGGGMQ